MAFKGCIVYSRTVSEVENAAKELLKIVETRMGGTDQIVLGFDIEWRPSFIKGFCSPLCLCHALDCTFYLISASFVHRHD